MQPIRHTSLMKQFATMYCGRFVQFYMRPPLVGKMKYRRPILFDEQWYKNKREALKAIKKWEMMA